MRACVPTDKINRSKRYKACSDLSSDFHSDIFIIYLRPLNVPSIRKPAERLRVEKEEQWNERTPTFLQKSRSKRYVACSDVVREAGLEPARP